MGAIRKLLYAGTRGVIDIRTDAERIEGYARRLERARRADEQSSPRVPETDAHRGRATRNSS